MLAPSSRQRYCRVLTKADRIPQQHVMILWDTDPAVVEVEVIFVPRDAATEAPDTPWYGFDDYAAEWDNSAGNRSGDWLTTESHTSAAVLGQLMARGFSSRVAMVNALDEFAQIEEANWAREMVAAFG